MRLLPRSATSYPLEFFNGFEGFDFNQGDQLVNDGWTMGGSDKADWDAWTDQGGNHRTGSLSFNRMDGGSDRNLYRSVTAGKSFIFEAYVYFEDTVGGQVYQHIFQFDDGDGNDDMNDPTNYIRLTIEYANASPTFCTMRVNTKFGGSTQEEYASNATNEFDNTMVGIKFVVTATTFEIWTDIADTGTWSLYRSEVFINTGTLGNMDVFRFWDDADDTADPSLEIDDITVNRVVFTSGDEIADITAAQCSVAEDMNGSAVVTITDRHMANFSTLKDNVRFEGVLKKDDLSRTLGEYTFARQSFTRHSVTFLGIETGKVLQKVPAEYNAILAEGEVTAINGEEITDSKAAFAAALVGKFCTFTDTTGPESGVAYPGAASDVYESDRTTGLTPHSEKGTYEDMAEVPGVWETVDDHNDYCHVLVFTVANAATADALAIKLSIAFSLRTYYTTLPDIYIYNVDTTTWDKISDLDFPYYLGIGDPIEYNFDQDDFVDNDLSHYFDGTTMKIAIHAGVVDTDYEYLACLFCSVTDYSSEFTAQDTIFTVDARTGTTLTFTGQNAETAGVDVGDRYKVGDVLSTIVTEIWNAAIITWLTLNMEVTSKVDAADWQSSPILPVLDIYTRRMGGRLWQSIGYNINIATTFTSTGLTLHEEDEVTDANGNGFQYLPDGSNIISKAKVFGAGVFVEGTQTPEYLSRQGSIITDGRVASQKAANDLLTQELADNIGPRETFKITVDLDMTAARTWDSSLSYDAILLLRTIDVSLSIGGVEKIAITDGLITNIHFFQSNDSHLRATLTIEVV